MKNNFSPKAFREAENKILNEGELCGKEVASLEEINEVLANELGYDKDTVRKWRYDNSNGPGDINVIKQLEDIFKTPLRETRKYSEYAKKQINKGYVLIRRYIRSFDADDENCFCEFEEAFEELKACIPKEVYNKMESFIEEKVKPMVYDPATVFADESIETYVKTTSKISNELDKFADEELYEYIVY